MNLFESWDRLIGTALSCGIFFVAIVVVIRLSGKRTTANMNNFDWIVSVAIGSLASSGILLSNVTVADALTAIIALAGLQWLTTWATVRFDWFARLIKPRPRLLIHKGQYLKPAMLKERIAKEELDAAMRAAGYTSAGDANWVIIETNGQMTVIPRQEADVREAELLDRVRAQEATA